MADTAVSGRVLTVPNGLSVLRLVLVPTFVVLVLARHDVWAFVVLAASSASDFLDGHLARRWDQVTRLGQLLDPAADRLFVLSTLVGLALRGLVPWWVVALVVGRDLVLLSTVPVLARAGYGPLPVHYLGKAATFCLLNSFPLILLAEFSGAAGGAVRALGWALAWWGTALYWWAGLLYLRQVRDVVRAGPPSPRPPGPGSAPGSGPGSGSVVGPAGGPVVGRGGPR